MTKSLFTVFKVAVSSLMTMAEKGEEGLVQMLAIVDSIYTLAAKDSSSQDMLKQEIRERTLTALQENAVLLARLNFVYSLVSLASSPFFRAVMELCAEHEKDLKIHELMSIVEAFRRGKNYPQMERFEKMLEQKLWKTRSNASYQLSMAAYQQAETTIDANETVSLLQKAMELAKKSAGEADIAGDRPGWLYGYMNIGGLFMPRLGQWKEAIALSEKVCTEAEELADKAADKSERERILRIAMNTYFHRIEIEMKYGGDTVAIERWLQNLQSNPVYHVGQDQDWATKPVLAALAFIQEKKR